jgi:hypothetical protein
MIALEIYVDGQEVATAGVGESGSLLATVSWAKQH